jgi:hypothetical protein
MSKTDANTGKTAKNPNGAGRRKGSVNMRTRLKAEAFATAVKAQLERMTEEEITALTPLDTLLLVMKNAFRAGDFASAMAAAEKAAPYLHAKQLATPPEMQMPPELMPGYAGPELDPPSRPDEPVPANPVR